MAIYHLTAKTISRGKGQSAHAAAAYRSGAVLVDGSGKRHDYTRKEGVVFGEVLAPAGAPSWATNRQELWNEVEAKEHRRDSQLARELEISLPHELTLSQNIDLIKDFVQTELVSRGMVADINIHRGHGDKRNLHAHIMLTTRTIGAEGFEGKNRGWNSKQELFAVREKWAEAANAALAKHGHTDRVSHESYAVRKINLKGQLKKGAKALHGNAYERAERADQSREQQRLAILANPRLITKVITSTRATFSRQDVRRELNRYIDNVEEFQRLEARIMGGGDVVKLASNTFTTKTMLTTEVAMLNSARQLAKSNGHNVAESIVQQALRHNPTLSGEQAGLVKHLLSDGGLKLGVGDAGTGKSFALNIAANAWQRAGYRVQGLALSGIAAQGLGEAGTFDGRTIDSYLLRLESGADKLNKRSVLIVDEAGMVGSQKMGRLLKIAQRAGAKVVLVGDDKQLPAISAGAAFRALKERLPATEVATIRRQENEWQRAASEQFARGSVKAALGSYFKNKRISAANGKEQAIKLVSKKYLEFASQGSAAVVTHTNKNAKLINNAIRQARIDRGEMQAGHAFKADDGMLEFSAGDRVMCRKNDHQLNVKNGTLGTVLNSNDDEIIVKFDTGHTATINANTYKHVQHGYAATVHKNQGVTVDRAVFYATGGITKNLAYVAMTRHKKDCALVANSQEIKTFGDLVRTLSKRDEKTSTLDYWDEARQEQEREAKAAEARTKAAKAAEVSALFGRFRQRMAQQQTKAPKRPVEAAKPATPSLSPSEPRKAWESQISAPQPQQRRRSMTMEERIADQNRRYAEAARAREAEFKANMARLEAEEARQEAIEAQQRQNTRPRAPRGPSM